MKHWCANKDQPGPCESAFAATVSRFGAQVERLSWSAKEPLIKSRLVKGTASAVP